MNSLGGRPAFFNTKEELETKIEEYFKSCGHQIQLMPDGTPLYNLKGEPVLVLVPPTVAGLALFLGFMDRQSIYDYKNRSEEFSCIIKRAVLAIEKYNEEQLTCNAKPVGAIFWLKNHNWKDENIIEQKSKIQILDNVPNE